MNTLLANLTAAVQNRHIAWPLYIALALEVVPIWFPQYKQACSDTQKLLLGYGVIAAANSGPAGGDSSSPTPNPPVPPSKPPASL